MVNGVQRLCAAPHRHGGKVTAAKGSVVDYTGSAIVNAANEGCIGGGGVDGAICDRGGEALHNARKALPIIGKRGRVRCPTGQAKTTIAGDLNCEWVIHAVGPNYRCEDSDDDGDALLYSAYASAMLEARANSLPDVAFCLLSSGIFRGSRPLKTVLEIGVLAVWAAAYEGLDEAFLVGFTRQEVELIAAAVDELVFSPDAKSNRESLVESLPRSVQLMHARVLAGLEPVAPQPIGWAMAWAAAAAGGGGSSGPPADMSDV